MKALRNLAALPLILIALALYWLADFCAWLSQGCGDTASRIVGPER